MHMHDPVDHPPHYTGHASGVEAIEICETLDFCLGNAVKYLFRAGRKNPILQDLQKSAWYLRRARKRQQEPLRLPFIEQMMSVRRAEKDGSVLDGVLEALFRQPGSIDVALARVEREIERVQEGR
jgi:hypothetical protein